MRAPRTCDPRNRRFPRRQVARAITAGVLLLAIACSPRAEVTERPAAAPTPDVAPRPHAVLPDGSELVLELAETREEIAQGLMYRPSLSSDRGMLFLFEVERIPSFWMKNTLISLDLVFLDGGGRVLDLIENARPCKVEPCPQYTTNQPVWAVLEVSAGTVAQHGLAVGDLIRFEGVNGYPRSEE